MGNVREHIKQVSEHVGRMKPEYATNYEILPKRFMVEKISSEGKMALEFSEREERVLEGRLITERYAGAGRVFFLPEPKIDEKGVERWIEIKGYGQDGREMCLWTHCDGDINFGMFYKNAKKEYDILTVASNAGLKVPKPLFLGKIHRSEWLRSGLRVINKVSDGKKVKIDKLALSDVHSIRQEVEDVVKRIPYWERGNPFSAFEQPYNAGVVARAPISPLRLGDPADEYELTGENKDIARQCGHTFAGLIDLGYLHLSPGTGNFTEAGELTDMADCYDLRRDRNLGKIISERQERTRQNFWQSLIGKYNTSNLSPFFIEGIFEEQLSLEEAAIKVEERAKNKVEEFRYSNSS